MWNLRPARPSDTAAMLAIYAPFIRRTTVTFEYEVPSEADFAQRVAQTQRAYPWLVCERDGIVVGYAYLARLFERAAFSWVAEPSVYLAPDARGHGVGSALYAALEALAVQMGICKLYSLVATENTGSLRFHEALGYRHAWRMGSCGFKLGRWVGLDWLEKQLLDGTPGPLVPFPALDPAQVEATLRRAAERITE